jgi:hypothetical protein
MTTHSAPSTTGRSASSVQNGVIGACTSRSAFERPSALIASTPAPAISATEIDRAAA